MIGLLIRFLLGALIYMGIEVAWDGDSHRSMGLVGGLSFVIGGGLNEWFGIGYFAQMLLIAIIIVVLEYIAGRIFNADYKIWDYRKMFFNLDGQICLTYFVVWWLFISHVIMYLDNAFRLVF